MHMYTLILTTQTHGEQTDKTHAHTRIPSHHSLSFSLSLSLSLSVTHIHTHTQKHTEKKTCTFYTLKKQRKAGAQNTWCARARFMYGKIVLHLCFLQTETCYAHWYKVHMWVQYVTFAPDCCMMLFMTVPPLPCNTCFYYLSKRRKSIDQHLFVTDIAAMQANMIKVTAQQIYLLRY